MPLQSLCSYLQLLTMPTPSLILVPARFKTGKLYTPLATTSGGVVLGASGDFNVTRNTTATRFNSAGRIESVASGVPRLDYYTSGGTAGCPALLVEPSGSNLCLQSQDFTTTWSPTNVTVSANVTGTTDPFGTNLAEQLFETTTSGLHFLAQTMSITSGTTYAGSIFFKKAAGSPDWMQVAFSTTGLAGFANFNLTSGTVGNVGAGCTGRIENYGNGWYRCTLIQTATASGTSGGPIPAFINNTDSVTRFVSYAGSTATSIYIFGAQLETGSIATSYIPTTTGTGSRSGDLLTVTGAVSGSIGQTAGTFYLDITYSLRLTSTATRWIQVFGSSNNIGLAVASTNIVRSIVNGQSDNLSTPSTANGVKIAWGYDGSGVVCFVNGTQYTLTNGGAQIITQLNQISLDLSTTNAIGNCRLRAMALYTTRLTNAELATLTTL
jgi:hypothetical protein